MARFLSDLDVDYVDGNFWKLCKPLIYQVDDNGADIISVPEGFFTDFFSVPPILRWIFPKAEQGAPASVIHDWLYFSKKRSRIESDMIFCEAMKALGCPNYKCEIMFYAVRAFGWLAWNYVKDKYNHLS